MLADFIRETTTTTGTGTLTLAGAVSGFAPFSAAFSDGDSVHYTIESGAGRETGVGVYSAGTLARSFVISTWDGTAHTEGGTALSLTGTSTVMVAATVSVAAAGPARTRQAFGDNGWDKPDNISASGNNAAVRAIDMAQYVPFRLDRPRPVSKVAISVGTADAGAPTCFAGLYSGKNDTNGYNPHLRLWQQSLDVTTTGMKIFTLGTPLFLRPGYYFFTIACSSATPQFLGAEAFGAMAGLPVEGTRFSSYTIYAPEQTLSPGWSELPSSAAPNGQNVLRNFVFLFQR